MQGVDREFVRGGLSCPRVRRWFALYDHHVAPEGFLLRVRCPHQWEEPVLQSAVKQKLLPEFGGQEGGEVADSRAPAQTGPRRRV